MNINPNDDEKKNIWLIVLKIFGKTIFLFSSFLVFSSYFFTDFNSAMYLMVFLILSTIIADVFANLKYQTERIDGPFVFIMVTFITILVVLLNTNLYEQSRGIYHEIFPNSFIDIARNILSPSNEIDKPASELIKPLASPYFSPQRKTYLIDNRPDFPVINSITNNSTIGDERDFFRVERVGVADWEFSNEISLKPGVIYSGFLHFFNDSIESSNNTAINTRISLQLPTEILSQKNVTASSTIKSENSFPQSVTDRVLLKNENDRDIVIRYIPGTALIINNGQLNGEKIHFQDLTGRGLKLGFDEKNGVLLPGEWYGGYIIFDFIIEKHDFSISLEASPLTTPRRWTPYSLILSDENTFEIRIKYLNTGTTEQRDVILSLRGPQGLSYVEGSTELSSPNTTWKSKKLSDDIFSDTGVNIGHYAPWTEAYVKATFKIDSKFCENAGWYKGPLTASLKEKNGVKEQAIYLTFYKPFQE